MTKAIGLFLLLAMIVHIIRPLGLPGLKKRGDCWKIAVAAFVIHVVRVALFQRRLARRRPEAAHAED